MKITVNINYYVYLHRRRTDGKIFYVGKGCDGRAWAVEGRNLKWLKEAAEYGRTVEIVAVALSEKDAFHKEHELIERHRREGQPLTNIISSGVGVNRAHIGKTPIYPHAIFNGENYWSWRRDAKRSGWKLATVETMMREYGGCRKDWQRVIDRKSVVGPYGWRLIAPRTIRSEP